MNKNDWNKEFPDAPISFHNKIESTLNKIAIIKNKSFSRKKIAILVFAAVFTLGSFSVMASGLFQWNQTLAEIFGANKEQQNKLIEKGVTQKENASVTNKGLTISLVQTLQDKKYFYALLEVTAPKDIKLTDTNLFENLHFDVNGEKEFYNNISSGFMDILKESEISNKRYYEIWINKKVSFAEKDITLHFKNLQADFGNLDMHTILEGDWSLTWKMSYQDSSEYFNLNRKFKFSGYDILVKRVEISPLSMAVYYDSIDIKSMEKAENVSLNKLDSLEPITFKGVRYNDGKVISIMGGPGECAFIQETGEYKVSTSFNKVIESEKVKGLLFGTDNSEIDLTK